MRKIITLLAFLALLDGTASSDAQPSSATIKFGNKSEDAASIKIDGKDVCTVPDSHYCTTHVSAGSHTFEILWPGPYRVSGSANMKAGDSKLLCADSDGAAWEDPAKGCADFSGLLRRDYKEHH
jgi:hypothetical protein